MDRGGEQAQRSVIWRRFLSANGLINGCTALWNYERYGVPFHEGGSYFFSKNSGLQNQSVLYAAANLRRAARPAGSKCALEDGTIALSGLAVPDNGKLLAYGLATAGSDWQEWKVRDIATGKGSQRRSEVGEIFGRIVEPRRQRILL